MLGFWAVMLPIAALFFFPWVFITGDVLPLYRVAMWGAGAGVRLAGVRAQAVGVENLNRDRTYVFMSNHASNIDPPLLLPIIPGRTSVLVKRELFKIPILGRAMRMGALVPVDRGNRDAGIAAVTKAEDVVKQGIHMTIYVEGHRSYDGKLLPFKKGPFYLATDSGIPIVPVTVTGTEKLMPKGAAIIRPGKAILTFHPPIDPQRFETKEALIDAVRAAISSALPKELHDQTTINGLTADC